MGRKAKRARLSARIARLTGETNATSEPTLVAENSQKIEELKTKNPEPVIVEPVTLEEPPFVVEAPEVEVKKTTTKKRAPRKKTTTRARKTNTTKSKSISSKQ